MSTQRVIARVQQSLTHADKLKAVQDYIKGEDSLATVAQRHGVAHSSLGFWVQQHKKGMLGGSVSHTRNNLTESLEEKLNSKVKELVAKKLLEVLNSIKL